MTLNVINRFKDEYRFLSNFVDVTVVYPRGTALEMTYPSVEHAYQAAKTLDRTLREWVRDAPTAREAKNRGNELTLRSGWNELRLVVMKNLLEQKFSQHPFREQLLSTGDAALIEGNHWHDRFWGDCYCEQHIGMGGLNHLGHLLMDIRSELHG